jgi:hypothetical protein
MGVSIVYNIGTDGLTLSSFLNDIHGLELRYAATASWRTGTRLRDVDDEKPAALFMSDHSEHAVFELGDGCSAYVSVEHESAFAYVAADHVQTAEEGLARVRELIPEGDSTTEQQVAITFWALGQNGPMQVRRNLDAPPWADIEQNYTYATRCQVDRLMDGFRPGRGGQLILWAGKPGTGKTTAIRALAREWRDWAQVHYITDPDKFFGDEAAYMLSVLLDDEDDDDHHHHAHRGRDEVRTPRWRVLLLEDAGELLAPDARERTGQGLSRFLNAVDGLIGQGLRVLVLVTTNEDVRKLNPAVARPGRCAANIEFGQFTAEEADAWLLAHDAGRNGETDPATLAELYAHVEGFDGQGVSRPLGFRAT